MCGAAFVTVMRKEINLQITAPYDEYKNCS